MSQQQVDGAMEEQTQRLARNQSHSSGTNSIHKVADPEKVQKDVHHDEERKEEEVSGLSRLYCSYRPLFLAAIAAVILGWWISATILEATRHRW